MPQRLLAVPEDALKTYWVKILNQENYPPLGLSLCCPEDGSASALPKMVQGQICAHQELMTLP